MDQISRLVFDVQARENASKGLLSVANASDKAHLGMSKLGSTLSGLGGPFDLVLGYASNLGSAFDETLARGQKLGLGLTAMGAGLIAVGAGGQQAEKQLQQAIGNTGAVYSDYESRINSAIGQQEHFAHSATDTDNALTALTTATRDPSRALSELGFAANVAAIKHESLAQAADQVVLAQEGNLRTLKALGGVMDGTGSKTDQLNRALAQVQRNISGQASASVDTFTGKLKVWGVELEDDISRLSKYGPVLTASGAALTVVSTARQILVARRLASTAAAIRETAANTALAESYNLVAASAGRAGVAEVGAAGAGSVIGAGMAANLPGYASLATRATLGLGLAYGAYSTYKTVTTPNPTTGLTSEESDLVKQIEKAGATAVQKTLSDPTHLHLPSGTPISFNKAADDKIRAALQAYAVGTGIDKSATDKAKVAADQYTTSLLAEKDAITKATLSLDGQIKALQASEGANSGLLQAQDDLQSSMHNLAQAVHDGGHALDGHTLAAEANRTALRDAADKMLALIAAQKAAGVSGEKVRASAVAMSQALERNATKLLGNKQAVDEFLKRLGLLPPQIAKALGATDLLAEQEGQAVMDYFAQGIADNSYKAQVAASVAASQTIKQMRLGDMAAGIAPQSYIPKHDKASEAAKKYGDHVAQTYVDNYTGGIDSPTAKNKAQQAAEQLAKSTEQAAVQAFSSMRKQIVDSFNLTSLPQKTDLFGTPYGPTNLARAANAYVRQLEEWARLLGELRRKGLNETAIAQFEAAGVAAIPAMRQVLKDREIKTLNKDFRIIGGIGTQVAGADVTATMGGHLEHVLARLPERLATALEKKFQHMHIDVSVHEVSKHQAHHVRRR